MLGTIVLGVLGSFLGGFILNLIEYHTLAVHTLRAAGIIGSVAGALILLILYRLSGHERGHKRSSRSPVQPQPEQPPPPLDLTPPAGPRRAGPTTGLATSWSRPASRANGPAPPPWVPGRLRAACPGPGPALGRAWTQATGWTSRRRWSAGSSNPTREGGYFRESYRSGLRTVPGRVAG